MNGRLLVFGLDELRLQSAGGRGLTLIDLEAKDALVSVAAFRDALQVLGTSLRGGKPREDVLKAAALAAHVGKRARKGKAVDGMKAQRVVPAG
jgi:topoisomerase-4 subunit A